MNKIFQKRNSRILKEYADLNDSIQKNLLQNDIRDLNVFFYIDENEQEVLHKWNVTFKAPWDSVFEMDSYYMLCVEFPENYPHEPPRVNFFSENMMHPPPKHEHIYSNGDICLSTLYDDWSPAIGVKGILLQLVSMLSSAKEKKSPPEEKKYLLETKYMKNSVWHFHDLNC